MADAASQRATPSTALALSVLMAAVFVVFLITGVALPALPLHIQQGLGLGAFAVGLVSGGQFAASLVSRVWSGAYADRRGAKRAVVVGLALASAGGALYLLSLRFAAEPVVSAAILLAGRAALGGAESFVIVGAQSWGLALAGGNCAGRVIAWFGVAMYAAFALGGPLGSALFAAYGFAAIALVTLLVPIAVASLVAPLSAVAPQSHPAPDYAKVAKAVSGPGIALAFSSVGFGVTTAFAILLWVERGWTPAWLSYTVFAVAFMAARMVFGQLVDQKGGARVAALSALIEAAGFAIVWASPWPWLGFVGAALTGFGYSLVFPGLGVEAVRRAPPEARGMAIGVFTAFLDVALGVLIPALGLLASVAGLGAIFAVSAALALCAAPIAWRLTDQ